MECTVTAGRLSLGLLGLEGDALGSSALLARDRDDQLFLGLGQRRVWAERLVKCSTALVLGTAMTLWSTALARDIGSRKKLAECQGTDLRVLGRTRARFPSVYPLRDCSRSQFFIDEGES